MFKVVVFESLNQRILYIVEINYYFSIDSNIDADVLLPGEYVLAQRELLNYVEKLSPTLLDSIQKITDNFKDKKFDKDNYFVDIAKTEHILCLHPSRKCNLNCAYCFKGEKYLSERSLSFKTAKDAIDFFIHTYAKNASQYIIDLTGSGEPLLEFNLIKQITEYCEQKRDEMGKKVVVMFATNATCLTDEIVDFIDKSSLIIVGVSIDGDKCFNDKNRVYKNQKGTYDDVINGINSFKSKQPGLAVTITPKNQEVDLIYNHLYHLNNIDCVSLRFLRQFDGSEYDFERFDLKSLMKSYDRLCENILKELRNDNFDYLKRLLAGADYFGSYIKSNIIKRALRDFKCDAGKQRIAIDCKGDIYSCSVMMGNETFKMGNIYSGINKNSNIDYTEPNVLKSYKCQNCFVKNICGGECYAVAFLKNGNPYKPYNKMCEIKRGLIKRSLAILEIIKCQYPNMFKKLVNFVFDSYNHHQNDTGIWSVMKILQYYSIPSKYIDIIKKLNPSSQGVHPTNLMGFLDEYLKGVEAFAMDKLDDFTEHIYFPAIGFVNKRKNLRFYYWVLLGTENGNLIVHSIEDDQLLSIPINEYISDYSDIIIAKKIPVQN